MLFKHLLNTFSLWYQLVPLIKLFILNDYNHERFFKERDLSLTACKFIALDIDPIGQVDKWLYDDVTYCKWLLSIYKKHYVLVFPSVSLSEGSGGRVRYLAGSHGQQPLDYIG